MKPKLTAHAQKRAQQRAISETQIQLITVFGERHYQQGGTEIAFIPHKKIAELRHALDHLEKKLLVVGDEEKILTAMNQTHQIRRTKLVA